MNVQPPYAATRKINPRPGQAAALKPDGTPDDNDRVEIGPTPLAFAEWAEAGLEIPHLPTMRQCRLDRLVKMLRERDYGAILMFDPLNIRYASDTTNMQIWAMHDPFRACFVTADGYMIIWDFMGLDDLLTAHNPLVRETRGGASFFYFINGDKTREDAANFAGEIDSLMREHCGGNRRLAVDKIMVHGLRALEALGIEVMESEEVTEKARVVKGPDDLRALRCAMHSCEAALAAMERASAPGMTEAEVWAVLHAENIKRGGEWIETRLLASGPRTNPWFQECGPRKLQNNEILAFDTDLVGIYGFCIDISRTWWIGDQAPRADMIEAYKHAVEHMRTNEQLVKPGTTMKELTFGGHQLDPKYVARQYSCRFHGVGLCDEWPCIPYKEEFQEGANDYELEPGMCLCVEALVGEEGGDFCIKLEDQLIVTETGCENITQYPYDARLLGEA